MVRPDANATGRRRYWPLWPSQSQQVTRQPKRRFSLSAGFLANLASANWTRLSLAPYGNEYIQTSETWHETPGKLPGQTMETFDPTEVVGKPARGGGDSRSVW